ncbi:MAG: hypothetical protein JST87_01085 [Bacteroidetes bacterium]|nr:hypothetical protein [Bacteroidota bacterium]
MKRGFVAAKVLKIILFVVIGVLLFGSIVMWLWNAVLVQVLHVQAITFAQALGLLLLSKILFGGFRGAHWGREKWKAKMHERWEKMSPEDREKFKQEWQNRCGRGFGRRFEEADKTGE